MRVSFTILILWAVMPLLGQSPSERLELLDVFELKYASNPQINPEGTKIVYQQNFKDIMTDRNLSNLWMVDYSGQNHRPISTGKHRDWSVTWSPDGSRLAFLSDRDGSTQIYVYWIEGGALQRLSNLTGTPQGVRWSPDGRQLAFAMKVTEKPAQLVDLPPKPAGAQWAAEPIYINSLKYRSDGKGYLTAGYTQLFLTDLASGHVRQITRGPYEHSMDFCWMPSSKALVFSANRHQDRTLDPNNTEIYLLRLASGEVTPLTDRQGPDRKPVVSPDGRYLAYLGYDEKYRGYQQDQPYLMDLNTRDSRLIPNRLDRNFDDLKWHHGSRGLYFQYNSFGDTHLGHLSTEGKVTDLVSRVGGLSLGRPYSGGEFSVSQNGRLAYTLVGTQHPAEVGVATYPSGNNGRLTYLNKGLFAHKKLGAVEEMWYQSSFDGRRIQGWLVKPPNFDPSKKYPLILEIHGGPFANYGARFSAEMQLYAAAGYVVFYANPRGSTSYGYEFGNLIHHNYPSEDFYDLMAGVTSVIQQGYIDEDELFITGGSGGGVLTAWTIGKTDRFKAAVVAKPVINWYSFVLYADNPAFFYKYWFPGLPWDPAHTQQYLDRSPLSLVGDVNTPTMLLTGEEDYRTPIAESEQYYAALKLRGVDAAMVRIPGASHGIAAKPSQLIAKVAYILGWFERYGG